MSKRTGKAISLSDLLDEVSVDAARWYFNAKPDTQMEFDLGLAVREDSENPIYYVEYAHARICSLLRTLGRRGPRPGPADVDMSLLAGETETALIKQLAQFCEEIKLAARDYDPQPHQPLPPGAGGVLPPFLQRLPHQRRGGRGAGGPAEAGGRHPRGAEKRTEAYRRGRTGKMMSEDCMPRL